MVDKYLYVLNMLSSKYKDIVIIIIIIICIISSPVPNAHR